MMYYCVVVDYAGWCVFQNQNLTELLRWQDKYQRFFYVTTCLSNAEKIASLLRKRNIY